MWVGSIFKERGNSRGISFCLGVGDDVLELRGAQVEREGFGLGWGLGCGVGMSLRCAGVGMSLRCGGA